MTSQRSYQTEAIIIKKTKLGEADSILTMFTPQMGKIQGFAKSLRMPKSRLAGHLELLTHSTVSFVRGKGIDTITGSQTITGFLPLKTDLDLISYGLYATELVNQFTPEHLANYPVFSLLLETLERLCDAADRDMLMRRFELHLLQSSGYRPQLKQCLVCHTALQPENNSFCAAIGGMLCPNCCRTQASTILLSVNAQKVLRLLQTDDYETASRLKIPQELHNEIAGVMKSYLRYLLEREVKSAEWLDTLKRQSSG